MTTFERIVARWLFGRVVRGPNALSAAMAILVDCSMREFPEDSVITSCQYIRDTIDHIQRIATHPTAAGEKAE